MNEQLTALRNKIDAIDVQLIDLLRKRADVIEEVRAVKGKLPVYIRPGREAVMLRALVNLPMGHIPQGLVHRLWREMIGAFTLQEGAMHVAVAMQKGEEGFWDIARDHFGSFTPMHAFDDTTAAMRAVLDGGHPLAAIPFPREGDAAWWRLLLATGSTIPNVFYAFPFDGVDGNARKHNHEGLVLGLLSPEATGDDRSILVVEWKQAELAEKALLVLPHKMVRHVATAAGQEAACSWIEVQGFVKPDDEKLTAWAQQHAANILRSKIVGAYPVPMQAKAGT